MLPALVVVVAVGAVALTVLSLLAVRSALAPGRLQLGLAALVEVALLVQAVLAVASMVRGDGPEGSLVLFWSYLVTVVLVLPAALAWAWVERDRWSSGVLAVAGLTVAAMTVRLLDVWVGGLQYGAPGA